MASCSGVNLMCFYWTGTKLGSTYSWCILIEGSILVMSAYDKEKQSQCSTDTAINSSRKSEAELQYRWLELETRDRFVLHQDSPSEAWYSSRRLLLNCLGGHYYVLHNLLQQRSSIFTLSLSGGFVYQVNFRWRSLIDLEVRTITTPRSLIFAIERLDSPRCRELHHLMVGRRHLLQMMDPRPSQYHIEGWGCDNHLKFLMKVESPTIDGEIYPSRGLPMLSAKPNEGDHFPCYLRP